MSGAELSNPSGAGTYTLDARTILIYFHFFFSMDLNQNKVNDQTELKARGDWNQLKGEAKQKWGQLTDSDLDYADGKQEEWFGKLQEKTGHAIDDIKNWFHKKV